MPQTIRAIVVDHAAPGRLAIKPVELRDPDRDEVQVKVTAISLNRGETRRAVQQAEPGWRPGWDFAGVVERAAADGSGPKAGTRVVGLLPNGAWAEQMGLLDDLWIIPPDVKNGMITAPERPGHGMAFKPEVLKDFRLAP